MDKNTESHWVFGVLAVIARFFCLYYTWNYIVQPSSQTLYVMAWWHPIVIIPAFRALFVK